MTISLLVLSGGVQVSEDGRQLRWVSDGEPQVQLWLVQQHVHHPEPVQTPQLAQLEHGLPQPQDHQRE